MSESSTQSDRTVLLVEDDPHVAKLEIKMLERAGFVVQWAETGVEGLLAARANRPAAIVLDGELPGLDGFEVCRQLKADADTRAIPVLFCSGKSDAAQLAPQAGADDFLAKPEEMALLGERVKKLLRI